MSVYIQNIHCRVPTTAYSQPFIKDRMKKWLKHSKKAQRLIENIYKQSHIRKRHSVISNIDDLFTPNPDGSISTPTTAQRNRIFTENAKKMYVNLARGAIIECQNSDFDQITHIITVSCTGFFNPGPDIEIIRKLNLNTDIQRYNIGFMGCYAAIPALKLAQSICRSDPTATVLIVAVELCTLHVQIEDNIDSILSAALFADGGAAAIVSAKKPLPTQQSLRIESFESELISNTESHMAWTIGDNGFDMILSHYIPEIIESNMPEIIESLMQKYNHMVTDIDHWAIHPGGKAILDKFESSLNLKNKLKESRSILAQYGNMSSPSILFVLNKIQNNKTIKPNESVMAMAFGPGLAVESAFLTKLTTQTQTEIHQLDKHTDPMIPLTVYEP
jgi:predicted naringenin-chalcone synthase